MGEVFLAKRVDGEFEREVAIKRLNPGPQGEQLMQRFLRERQTLARLDHEYIARLIDGGTSQDGQPYLVLEYVDGRPIDRYCREEQLDLRSRIQIFIEILRAVQYAHEHGVIHRDLKPSNILMRPDGHPRLLDFGIAFVIDSKHENTSRLTGTGQRLFTPEFASPEQVRGDSVAATTDVFSFGVLLYHLLTDTGPWGEDVSTHDPESRILAADPLPPSRRRTGTSRLALSGDLDTIIAGSLHKDPHQRLKSAALFADELDRHLQGLPIHTRSLGLAGRAIRRVRRKPWPGNEGTPVTAISAPFNLCGA